jgi:acetyl-CoA acyltransferase
MSSTYIVGAGQTRCGRFLDATVASLAIEALDAALTDAAFAPDRVDAIFFSNALSGLMTGQECVRGQVALRHSRYGGIPIANVENACASGSTALHLACQAIDAGAYETVAVVGSEKMSHTDRRRPIQALAGAPPRTTACSWTATLRGPNAGSTNTVGRRPTSPRW